MEAQRLKKLLSGAVDIRREEWRRVLPLTMAYGLVMASLYLFFMANLLIFWILLSQGAAWSFFAFYVWVTLYGLMATSLLWLLANAVFNPREARRLFGFIGTGGIVGAILGGILTGQIAEVVGAENLLLVCAGLLAMALVLARAIRFDEKIPDQEDRSEGILKSITHSELLRLLAITAGLTAVVAAVVEVQFNDIVDRAFPSRDAKAAFFGQFFAYLSGFALLFQVLATPRVLKTFGVGIALFFLPLGLATGSLVVLLAPGLWAGIAVKIGDGGFRHSIHKSATEILFLPVPPGIKRPTKLFLDTTVDNLATGMGAVLILVLTSTMGVPYRYLSLVSLGLIAVWIGLVFRVRGAYVHAFRIAMQRRSLDIGQESLSISDIGTIRILLRLLESENEREVEYALDLLETTKGVPLRSEI